VIESLLGDIPDPGIGRAIGVFRQPLLEAAVGDAAVEQVVAHQHRQQVGGVDQRVLGGLAKAGLSSLPKMFREKYTPRPTIRK
jgi:hypothetical protein